jgi:uncharacterized protein (TIGR03067 family)
MIRTFLLVLCLLAVTKDDPNKKDQDAMQGDWACERYVVSGMPLDDDNAQSIFRTNKDDGYTVYLFRKRLGGGTFKLDATKTPKQIDLMPEGKGKAGAVRGIYKLEKDTLTICYAAPGKERPATFEAKMDSGHTLTVWKKEKK